MSRGRRAGGSKPVGDRPHQHVGALLHGLRKQANVKQAAIATAIKVSASYISRIESGDRPASDRVIRYYAERFGAGELLAGLVDIAREAERDRERLRDPVLIERQNAYPLDGDEARFVSESPPDGVTVPCKASFVKTWTIRNSGSVPWHGRRLRRVGPTTGPWTLTSPRFVPIPDTEPGESVEISVPLFTPQMETAAVAQWKMVDPDDLLFFPTIYSVGLGLYVMVGHDASPEWRGNQLDNLVG